MNKFFKIVFVIFGVSIMGIAHAIPVDFRTVESQAKRNDHVDHFVNLLGKIPFTNVGLTREEVYPDSTKKLHYIFDLAKGVTIFKQHHFNTHHEYMPTPTSTPIPTPVPMAILLFLPGLLGLGYVSGHKKI